MAEDGGGHAGGEGGDLCCNDSQSAFLVLFTIYLVICFLTWQSDLMKPMRMIATFLHELSHALATWLTCGDVRKIRVFENEGGVTEYVGGCRILIIPAGYIGCSFWGMVFTVMSGGRKTATGAAAAFVAALLISLCYSPTRTMVYLNLGYAVVTLAFILVEWFAFSPILTYVILLYGVFIGTYSIYDIWAGLVKRTVIGSDAHACYQECPCCLPRCVGIQWAMIAFLLQLFGVWLALTLMADDCQDKSWGECVSQHGPISFAFDVPNWFEHTDFDFNNVDWNKYRPDNGGP